MREFDCVLFDLDGTLLDTSYDFAWALNALQKQEGVPLTPYWRIRQTISSGGRAVVKLGFPDADDATIEALRERFLQLYHENISVHTDLFPGLEKVLTHLQEKAVPWGIVTNKPAWLTDKLLGELDLPAQPQTVVSGDTLAVRKPHPEPMWLAAEQCGVAPERCLYIGDHPRDIEAPRNAGMKSAAALYGFLPLDAEPDSWPADYRYHAPADILHHMQKVFP